MTRIPVIDMEGMSEEKFKDELEFVLKSTDSCSDYRNDRDRPYNGQAHTDQGERGQQIITGLTMRDVADCIIQGFLAASCNEALQGKTKEIKDEFKGTEYANSNIWRYQDVYKIEADFDPIAVMQNAMCFIEDMMGIFPNLGEKAIKEREEFMQIINKKV